MDIKVIMNDAKCYVITLTNKQNNKFVVSTTGDLAKTLHEINYVFVNSTPEQTNACCSLVYLEGYIDATSALIREKQVASFSKKEKVELIIQGNIMWQILNDDIYKIGETRLL